MVFNLYNLLQWFAEDYDKIETSLFFRSFVVTPNLRRFLVTGDLYELSILANDFW